MAVRFVRCFVVVALLHVLAAALVFGAYHFTKAGNQRPKANSPSARFEYRIMAPANSSRTHVVRRGESHWSIARKYKVSLERLMAVNGHKRGRVLMSGDVLSIPDGD